MRRIVAFLIGCALAMAVPIPAFAAPLSHQQAVSYVLQRALAQRGVPYTYGGGDVSGPTRGVPQATSLTPGIATAQPAQIGPTLPGATFTPVDPTASALAAQQPEPQSNVTGFDASGLVVYAFAGVGIKLPRSSGEQYKVGTKVAPASALPGDLLFYGPEGTQSVALFLGNGQMIEATTPAVTVSPVRTDGMAPYLVRVIA